MSKFYELETKHGDFKLTYDDHDSIFKFYKKNKDEFDNVYWVSVALKDANKCIGEILFTLMNENPESIMVCTKEIEEKEKYATEGSPF